MKRSMTSLQFFIMALIARQTQLSGCFQNKFPLNFGASDGDVEFLSLAYNTQNGDIAIGGRTSSQSLTKATIDVDYPIIIVYDNVYYGIRFTKYLTLQFHRVDQMAYSPNGQYIVAHTHVEQALPKVIWIINSTDGTMLDFYQYKLKDHVIYNNAPQILIDNDRNVFAQIQSASSIESQIFKISHSNPLSAQWVAQMAAESYGLGLIFENNEAQTLYAYFLSHSTNQDIICFLNGTYNFDSYGPEIYWCAYYPSLSDSSYQMEKQNINDSTQMIVLASSTETMGDNYGQGTPRLRFHVLYIDMIDQTISNGATFIQKTMHSDASQYEIRDLKIWNETFITTVVVNQEKDQMYIVQAYIPVGTTQSQSFKIGYPTIFSQLVSHAYVYAYDPFPQVYQIGNSKPTYYSGILYKNDLDNNCIANITHSNEAFDSPLNDSGETHQLQNPPYSIFDHSISIQFFDQTNLINSFNFDLTMALFNYCTTVVVITEQPTFVYFDITQQSPFEQLFEFSFGNQNCLGTMPTFTYNIKRVDNLPLPGSLIFNSTDMKLTYSNSLMKKDSYKIVLEGVLQSNSITYKSGEIQVTISGNLGPPILSGKSILTDGAIEYGSSGNQYFPIYTSDPDGSTVNYTMTCDTQQIVQSYIEYDFEAFIIYGVPQTEQGKAYPCTLKLSDGTQFLPKMTTSYPFLLRFPSKGRNCSINPYPKFFSTDNSEVTLNSMDVYAAKPWIVLGGFTTDPTILNFISAGTPMQPVILLVDGTVQHQITWAKYLDQNGYQLNQLAFTKDGNRIIAYCGTSGSLIGRLLYIDSANGTIIHTKAFPNENFRKIPNTITTLLVDSQENAIVLGSRCISDCETTNPQMHMHIFSIPMSMPSKLTSSWSLELTLIKQHGEALTFGENDNVIYLFTMGKGAKLEMSLVKLDISNKNPKINWKNPFQTINGEVKLF